MVQATLIASKGAHRVTREELLSIPAPPPQGRHYPIKHGEVIETCERTLGDAGFAIQSAEYAVGKQSQQVFATFTLSAAISENVSLAVGVRSSYDKTLPLGMVAGSRVFVCSNLCFRADLINVRRLHTRNGGERFTHDITRAVSSLPAFQEAEARRVEIFRATPVSDAQAEALMLRACVDRKLLPLRALPALVNEWRHPAHEEFQPRNGWSLLNCFTSVLASVRERNPNVHAHRTMQLNRMLWLAQPQMEEPESHPLAV